MGNGQSDNEKVKKEINKYFALSAQCGPRSERENYQRKCENTISASSSGYGGGGPDFGAGVTLFPYEYEHWNFACGRFAIIYFVCVSGSRESARMRFLM